MCRKGKDQNWWHPKFWLSQWQCQQLKTAPAAERRSNRYHGPFSPDLFFELHSRSYYWCQARYPHYY